MLIAPAANAVSVAELTVALMLAASAIPRHDAAVRSGAWDRSMSACRCPDAPSASLGSARLAGSLRALPSDLACV